MCVLLEDRVALGFAYLLEDDLLGKLRGNAAQGTGVLVHADFAAHFNAGGEFVGLFERDLVHRILDLIVVGHHGLEHVGCDFAGLLVQLATHVFLGLVILACGQGNGLLHGANDNPGLDALLAA